jgi:AraC family transcriptional regulator of adaptative response/methylated-DNA-[protein]-cysteine methyltransferase
MSVHAVLPTTYLAAPAPATGAHARAAAGPVRYAVAPSSLGAVLVAASAAGVCAVLLGDDAELLAAEVRRRFPGAAPADDAAAAALAARVVEHIERPAGGADAPALPLDPRGTAFQLAVWEALREIPPGRTATYAQIAARIGLPTSARAVAQACAANPLAVLVPCHRVLRSDGGLSGYRWGVERKRVLLRREAEG